MSIKYSVAGVHGGITHSSHEQEAEATDRIEQGHFEGQPSMA